MTLCVPVDEDIAELVEVLKECAGTYLARARRDRINGDYDESEDNLQRAEVLAILARRLEVVAGNLPKDGPGAALWIPPPGVA